MMKRYRATGKEVQEDSKAFYVEFGELGGKEPAGPGWNPDKIVAKWAHLLAVQDGDHFDDYAMTDAHKVERYLEAWCPPPAKALLLGVGTGREVHAARLLGYDAVGTTLGKENRAFARWKLGIELDYVDNCTLPYDSKSFDVVAGFQLFEHCYSPYIFLFECCRVLKEGGLLILEWPSYMGTRGGKTTRLEEMLNFMEDYDDDNIHHACCWTPAQGRIITRRCNFENVEIYICGQVDCTPDNVAGLARITEKDDAYWSNISSGDIVLKANRRPDHKMPSYAVKLLQG